MCGRSKKEKVRARHMAKVNFAFVRIGLSEMAIHPRYLLTYHPYTHYLLYSVLRTNILPMLLARYRTYIEARLPPSNEPSILDEKQKKGSGTRKREKTLGPWEDGPHALNQIRNMYQRSSVGGINQFPLSWQIRRHGLEGGVDPDQSP